MTADWPTEARSIVQALPETVVIAAQDELTRNGVTVRYSVVEDALSRSLAICAALRAELPTLPGVGPVTRDEDGISVWVAGRRIYTDHTTSEDYRQHAASNFAVAAFLDQEAEKAGR